MSQIFYSQIDENLQKELNARGRAGVTDRSETALRYMTEKIANVSIIAYEGNKRDKNKIVHELGGRTVISGQYQPGGPDGFLTDRTYALKDSRWVINQDSLRSAQLSGNTGSLRTEDKTTTSRIVTDRSKRTPPFITQASLQINDNSKGTTNKATINITIPNPDRDLNYMETIYARPGRYCLLKIEHPDSALMTLSDPDVQGKLQTSALPNRDLIKARYPEAETEYEELRKMNKIQFEGLITAFEYSFNQDGTVAMTIYILGTSQTYTDMSMIMQTNVTGSNSGSATTVVSGSSFYSEIYKDINSAYENEQSTKQGKPVKPNYYAFGQLKPFIGNQPCWYFWNYSTLKGTNGQYITLNWLINFINSNILTKLNDVVEVPRIYSSFSYFCYSGKYDYLCSADPENVLLLSNATSDEDPNWQFKTDMYGQNRYIVTSNDNTQPFFYNYTQDKSDEAKEFGVSGNILISMNLIKEIQAAILNETKNTFTVGKFLEQLSSRISSATGGAINLKLVTDPDDLTLLYYRDTNWFKSTKKPVEPFNLPMYATHPNGTVIRDFKLSSKLPSSAQSLMYSINSSDKVTEDKLGPYINFMYNNGTAKRSPGVIKDANGKDVPVIDETTTYGGGQELSTRLAQEYLALHTKYVDELLKARVEFGLDTQNEQKRANLQVALTKYVQYPKPTIQQTNQISAPTFPIEAEFTIDGINGLRYGDVLDFPALPAKYKTNTTFTIKGLTHTISTNGEWTTNVSCLMRPKFD